MVKNGPIKEGDIEGMIMAAQDRALRTNGIKRIMDS